MKSFKFLREAAYRGNIGFAEMVEFYKKATKEQEQEMDKAIASNNWEKFRKIIQDVLGVKLK